MYATFYGKLGAQGVSSASAAQPSGGTNGIRIINALLLTTIVVLGAAYLVMTNRSATKGFLIKSAEQRISTLQDEQKKLDLQTLASESMDSIQDQVGGLGFVPVTNIEYVSGGAAPVAVR